MKRAPYAHIFVLAAFLVNTLGPIPIAQANDFRLPAPGVMVHLSPTFNPPILKGIKVNPNNPFQFDFILDKGDESSVITSAAKQSQQEQLKIEATKLIKYFLASLTIPEQDLWVNLSPYEKDRIIPKSFGLTEMGRDLLAEDYMLKQITASLIYPEDEIGKKFWKRIYEEAQKKFGPTNVPVNTFNKVWIIPEKAVVYENAQAGTAYVVESKLKVMLEQDYLSMSKRSGRGVTEGGASPAARNEVRTDGETRGQDPDMNKLGSDIVREIVIPELTKEVNENKNFAQLRQVYNSLILATWYKKKIKDSILEQVYADKNKTAGVQYASSVIPAKAGIHNKNDVEYIYQQYLKAFKKGVYNYIKEDIDPATQETIPRKYFSGGFNLAMTNMAMGGQSVLGVTHDAAMLNRSQDTKAAVQLTVILSLGALTVHAETSSQRLDTQKKHVKRVTTNHSKSRIKNIRVPTLSQPRVVLPSRLDYTNLPSIKLNSQQPILNLNFEDTSTPEARAAITKDALQTIADNIRRSGNGNISLGIIMSNMHIAPGRDLDTKIRIYSETLWKCFNDKEIAVNFRSILSDSPHPFYDFVQEISSLGAVESMFHIAARLKRADGNGSDIGIFGTQQTLFPFHDDPNYYSDHPEEYIEGAVKIMDKFLGKSLVKTKRLRKTFGPYFAESLNNITDREIDLIGFRVCWHAGPGVEESVIAKTIQAIYHPYLRGSFLPTEAAKFAVYAFPPKDVGQIDTQHPGIAGWQYSQQRINDNGLLLNKFRELKDIDQLKIPEVERNKLRNAKKQEIINFNEELKRKYAQAKYSVVGFYEPFPAERYEPSEMVLNVFDETSVDAAMNTNIVVEFNRAPGRINKVMRRIVQNWDKKRWENGLVLLRKYTGTKDTAKIENTVRWLLGDFYVDTFRKDKKEFGDFVLTLQGLYDQAPALTIALLKSNTSTRDVTEIASLLTDKTLSAQDRQFLLQIGEHDENQLSRLASVIDIKNRVYGFDKVRVVKIIRQAQEQGINILQALDDFKEYPRTTEALLDRKIYASQEKLADLNAKLKLAKWFSGNIDDEKAVFLVEHDLSLDQYGHFLGLERYFGDEQAIQMIRNAPQIATQNGWTTRFDPFNRWFSNLSAQDMVLVHRTQYVPEGGVIKTTRSATGLPGVRDTIHFTLNHPVMSHMEGNWDNVPYTIFVPLHMIPKSRIENMMGADSWVGGDLELPAGTVVLGLKGTPAPKNLGKAVYREIEPGEGRIESALSELGYAVQTAGIDHFGDRRIQDVFKEFLNNEGFELGSLHQNTWRHQYEQTLQFAPDEIVTREIDRVVNWDISKSTSPIAHINSSVKNHLSVLQYLMKRNDLPLDARINIAAYVQDFLNLGNMAAVGVVSVTDGTVDFDAINVNDLTAGIFRKWNDQHNISTNPNAIREAVLAFNKKWQQATGKTWEINLDDKAVQQVQEWLISQFGNHAMSTPKDRVMKSESHGMPEKLLISPLETFAITGANGKTLFDALQEAMPGESPYKQTQTDHHWVLPKAVYAPGAWVHLRFSGEDTSNPDLKMKIAQKVFDYVFSIGTMDAIKFATHVTHSAYYTNRDTKEGFVIITSEKNLNKLKERIQFLQRILPSEYKVGTDLYETRYNLIITTNAQGLLDPQRMAEHNFKLKQLNEALAYVNNSIWKTSRRYLVGAFTKELIEQFGSVEEAARVFSNSGIEENKQQEYIQMSFPDLTADQKPRYMANLARYLKYSFELDRETLAAEGGFGPSRGLVQIEGEHLFIRNAHWDTLGLIQRRELAEIMKVLEKLGGSSGASTSSAEPTRTEPSAASEAMKSQIPLGDRAMIEVENLSSRLNLKFDGDWILLLDNQPLTRLSEDHLTSQITFAYGNKYIIVVNSKKKDQESIFLEEELLAKNDIGPQIYGKSRTTNGNSFAVMDRIYSNESVSNDADSLGITLLDKLISASIAIDDLSIASHIIIGHKYGQTQADNRAWFVGGGGAKIFKGSRVALIHEYRGRGYGKYSGINAYVTENFDNELAKLPLKEKIRELTKYTYTKSEFDKYYPGLAKLFEASGHDDYVLRTLEQIKKLFTDAEFDEYFNDLVDIGVAAGSHAARLFVYNFRATRPFIHNKQDLLVWKSKLLRMCQLFKTSGSSGSRSGEPGIVLVGEKQQALARHEPRGQGDNTFIFTIFSRSSVMTNEDDILNFVSSHGGNAAKHVDFYLDLFEEHPQKALRIWEGLFTAIREGSVDIQLDQEEQHTIREFIEETGGFNPTVFKKFKELRKIKIVQTHSPIDKEETKQMSWFSRTLAGIVAKAVGHPLLETAVIVLTTPPHQWSQKLKEKRKVNVNLGIAIRPTDVQWIHTDIGWAASQAVQEADAEWKEAAARWQAAELRLKEESEKTRKLYDEYKIASEAEGVLSKKLFEEHRKQTKAYYKLQEAQESSANQTVITQLRSEWEAASIKTDQIRAEHQKASAISEAKRRIYDAANEKRYAAEEEVRKANQEYAWKMDQDIENTRKAYEERARKDAEERELRRRAAEDAQRKAEEADKAWKEAYAKWQQAQEEAKQRAEKEQAQREEARAQQEEQERAYEEASRANQEKEQEARYTKRDADEAKNQSNQTDQKGAQREAIKEKILREVKRESKVIVEEARKRGVKSKGYYILFGISEKASAEEIKKVFRKVAVRWHPDKNPNTEENPNAFLRAEVMFQMFNSIYEVLSNKDKRERYDRYGPGRNDPDYAMSSELQRTSDQNLIEEEGWRFALVQGHKAASLLGFKTYDAILTYQRQLQPITGVSWFDLPKVVQDMVRRGNINILITMANRAGRYMSQKEIYAHQGYNTIFVNFGFAYELFRYGFEEVKDLINDDNDFQRVGWKLIEIADKANQKAVVQDESDVKGGSLLKYFLTLMKGEVKDEQSLERIWQQFSKFIDTIQLVEGNSGNAISNCDKLEHIKSLVGEDIFYRDFDKMLRLLEKYKLMVLFFVNGLDAAKNGESRQVRSESADHENFVEMRLTFERVNNGLGKDRFSDLWNQLMQMADGPASSSDSLNPFDQLRLAERTDMKKNDEGNKAQLSRKGGIDLTPANMNLQVKTGSPTEAFGDGSGKEIASSLGSAPRNDIGIKFHLTPAMLAQLQNAPGFVPGIINIQPLKSLSEFLGLEKTVGNQQGVG